MTEMNGPGVAFECQEQNGMHFWEDCYLVEIIDPETGEPVPEGEIDELASLYEGKGQTAEAITLLKKLSAKYPEDDLIAYNTAEILWRNEGRVEASAIYESLREKLPKHYMANLRLTDWYYVFTIPLRSNCSMRAPSRN